MNWPQPPTPSADAVRRAKERELKEVWIAAYVAAIRADRQHPNFVAQKACEEFQKYFKGD